MLSRDSQTPLNFGDEFQVPTSFQFGRPFANFTASEKTNFLEFSKHAEMRATPGGGEFSINALKSFVHKHANAILNSHLGGAIYIGVESDSAGTVRGIQFSDKKQAGFYKKAIKQVIEKFRPVYVDKKIAQPKMSDFYKIHFVKVKGVPEQFLAQEGAKVYVIIVVLKPVVPVKSGDVYLFGTGTRPAGIGPMTVYVRDSLGTGQVLGPLSKADVRRIVAERKAALNKESEATKTSKKKGRSNVSGSWWICGLGA